jgi:hypothetical protein
MPSVSEMARADEEAKVAAWDYDNVRGPSAMVGASRAGDEVLKKSEEPSPYGSVLEGYGPKEPLPALSGVRNWMQMNYEKLNSLVRFAQVLADRMDGSSPERSTPGDGKVPVFANGVDEMQHINQLIEEEIKELDRQLARLNMRLG